MYQLPSMKWGQTYMYMITWPLHSIMWGQIYMITWPPTTQATTSGGAWSIWSHDHPLHRTQHQVGPDLYDHMTTHWTGHNIMWNQIYMITWPLHSIMWGQIYMITWPPTGQATTSCGTRSIWPTELTRFGWESVRLIPRDLKMGLLPC